MKFDPRKPHGTVTGHHAARFEQNGVMFNSAGNPLYDPDGEFELNPGQSDAVDNFSAVQKDFALDNAREFLTNILAGGPVARSAIFKECSTNNQDWEKVKTAFADMEGEVLTRRNVINWKLKAA